MYAQSLSLIFMLFILPGCSVNHQEKNNDGEKKVKTLLSNMTLEEKIGQMTQIDITVITAPEALNGANPIDQVKLEEAVLNYHIGSILNTPFTPHNKAQTVETWRKILQSVQTVAEKSRLKIPVLYGIDAIHGATYIKDSTLFPQAINMAATFNPDLSVKEGEITARELRTAGLQWNFSPVMDIGRQPLWPRLWETYGEDVHLASVLGTSFIEGNKAMIFLRPIKC